MREKRSALFSLFLIRSRTGERAAADYRDSSSAANEHTFTREIERVFDSLFFRGGALLLFGRAESEFNCGFIFEAGIIGAGLNWPLDEAPARAMIIRAARTLGIEPGSD